MKKVLGLLAILSLISFSCGNSEGAVVERTVKVWGNCGKCEKRIEDAARINGVKNAEWNQDSKLLVFKLDTAVVSDDEVLKNIAHAGHDNEKYFGDDYAYSKLPESCQYERRTE